MRLLYCMKICNYKIKLENLNRSNAAVSTVSKVCVLHEQREYMANYGLESISRYTHRSRYMYHSNYTTQKSCLYTDNKKLTQV